MEISQYRFCIDLLYQLPTRKPRHIVESCYLDIAGYICGSCCRLRWSRSTGPRK